MNELETNSNYGVVIAEDSASDRLLIKSAIAAAARLRLLAEVLDGVGVVAYLQGKGEFGDRQKFPIPHLLLLDLNMPRMNGFQVLEWLRTQSFAELTTVVLTDSLQSEHLKKALDLGADFFQVKPRTSHELQTIIRGLERHLSEATPIASYATSRIKRLRTEPFPALRGPEGLSRGWEFGQRWIFKPSNEANFDALASKLQKVSHLPACYQSVNRPDLGRGYLL